VSLNIYGKGFNYYSDAEQPVTTTLNGETGGFVCAGIAKLCQSVLITLLSDNVIFDPQWGSELPRYVTGGSASVLGANIGSIMSMSFSSVIGQLRRNERADAPNDERIKTLTLTKWAYLESGTGISITINVQSMAGESRDVVIPLGLTV